MSIVLLRVFRGISIEVPELHAFTCTLDYIKQNEIVYCVCSDNLLVSKLFQSTSMVHEHTLDTMLKKIAAKKQNTENAIIPLVLIALNDQDVLSFEKLISVSKYLNIQAIMVIGVGTDGWAKETLSTVIKANEPLVFLTLPPFPHRKYFLKDVSTVLINKNDIVKRIQGIGPCMQAMKINMKTDNLYNNIAELKLQ